RPARPSAAWSSSRPPTSPRRRRSPRATPTSCTVSSPRTRCARRATSSRSSRRRPRAGRDCRGDGSSRTLLRTPPRGATLLADAPKIQPGDIAGWPILKIEYRTDPGRIAALLPPGIEPGKSSIVYVSLYNVPVPDEPEYGCVIGVAADYKGQAGRYTL